MTSGTHSSRIVLDDPKAPEPNWCWRPEWCCGSDSIYGLLAKFGSLNALHSRDLCELFVERHSDKERLAKTGHPHFPEVDLRYVKNFQAARFSNLLRLDIERVQLGFVESLYPNSVHMASKDLIWCADCAKHGFHSATFQLNFSSVCPAHGKKLIRRCTKCSHGLPYSLKSNAKGGFFRCGHCGMDFAPGLRVPGHAANIDETAATMFAGHSDLVKFNDQLSTMIDACKTQVGRPNMPLFVGKPDLLRRGAAYRQFVSDVLTSVRQRVEGTAQDTFIGLSPAFVFSESPPELAMKPQRKVKRGVKPSAGSVGNVADRKLEDAWAIYRAVRRHLLHHHVCNHRKCIHHAMKTLWWNLEGESTQAFCPVALAYLRWRMQWEGKRVPSQLDDARKRGNLYGLMGWVSKDAPIFSAHWSESYESWLNAHLLAVACIDSFIEWTKISEMDFSKGTVRWCLNSHEHFMSRHWACSGRGSLVEPGLLFMEPAAIGPIASYRPSGTQKHVRSTITELENIRR
jgi:hypothetical protein